MFLVVVVLESFIVVLSVYVCVCVACKGLFIIKGSISTCIYFHKTICIILGLIDKNLWVTH